MKGILADINVQGPVDRLIALMQVEPWKSFWDHLELGYFHFTEIGLNPDAPDSLVWEVCQARQLCLLTDNRNRKGADSLEATIQSRNRPTSLPVFTISDVDKLRQSRAYADRVIERLFDFLFRIDGVRGTGRLYLP